jgi:hypothetical protein
LPASRLKESDNQSYQYPYFTLTSIIFDAFLFT